MVISGDANKVMGLPCVVDGPEEGREDEMLEADVGLDAAKISKVATAVVYESKSPKWQVS